MPTLWPLIRLAALLWPAGQTAAQIQALDIFWPRMRLAAVRPKYSGHVEQYTAAAEAVAAVAAAPAVCCSMIIYIKIYIYIYTFLKAFSVFRNYVNIF